jgi:hypothetical protein
MSLPQNIEHVGEDVSEDANEDARVASAPDKTHTCTITKTDISKINLRKIQTFYKTIMKIVKTGATIFGGCPRDLIIRENACEIFRNYCFENNLVLREMYNEPTCNPETYKDRNLIPTDIDILSTNDNCEILVEQIKQLGHISNITSKKLYREHFGIILKCLELNTMDKYNPDYCTSFGKFFYNHNNIKIKIDIVCAPFKRNLDEYISLKPDFLCNKLQIHFNPITDLIQYSVDQSIFKINHITTKYNSFAINNDTLWVCRSGGIRNSTLLAHDIYEIIVEQIIHKKAYLLLPDVHRIHKMMSKGWTIILDYKILVNYYNNIFNKITFVENINGGVDGVNKLTDEPCPICHEIYVENDIINSPVKLCSNSHYVHFKCFALSYLTQENALDTTPSCCLCREEYGHNFNNLCKMVVGYLHYIEEYKKLALGEITTISQSITYF